VATIGGQVGLLYRTVPEINHSAKPLHFADQTVVALGVFFDVGEGCGRLKASRGKDNKPCLGSIAQRNHGCLLFVSTVDLYFWNALDLEHPRVREEWQQEQQGEEQFGLEKQSNLGCFQLQISTLLSKSLSRKWFTSGCTPW
jgi:hypothetical protein